MIAATAALVLLGALAAASNAGAYAAAAEGAGAAGLLLLAAAVALRLAFLVPWAVAASAGGYLVGRTGGAGVDLWSPLVGVGLLVAAELAYWSIEHDRRIRVELRVTLARALAVAGVAAAGGVAGLLVLSATSLDVGAGLLLAAVGVAAAVAAVAVSLRLARPA